METQIKNKDKIKIRIKTTTREQQRKHKCALCLFSTNYITLLKRHMIKHSSEKPFKCPECPYRANRKDAVKQHQKHVHLLSSSSGSSRPFPCPHSGCSYAAKEKGNLTKHSKIHSGEKRFACSSPNCNYSTKQKVHLTAHIRIHTGEKPFVCQFESCSYATTQQSHLVIHTRTHTKEKPYKCPQPNCEYSAADNSNLRLHQLTHEPKEGEERSSFNCLIELCEYSTKYKTSLSTHIKHTHSLEKPFICSFESCEFRCKSQSHLSVHLKSHSDERQYKCALCPFRGKTRSTVTWHLKNVHADPNFRPFKCTETKCDFAAKTRDTLNRHLLIHKGKKRHNCSFPGCDYRSLRKSGVKCHEYNIHSEDKKEKCRICDFSCKTTYSLASHVRTHTKEEPFACKEEECEYRTKTLGNLRRHQKKKHP